MLKRLIESAFKEHYISLVIYASKYLKDYELSRDIVQSVFLKFLEKEKNLKIDNIKTYLFTSVRNSCLDYLKRESLFERKKNDLTLTEAQGFVDLIEVAEFETNLLKFVQELTPSTQRIFKMSRFENLENNQIAEKLNISKRTVELQISNALKSIREKFRLLELKENSTLKKTFFSL